MTRPLDRNANLPALGRIDKQRGEFWAENAFQMPAGGNNLSAFEANRTFINLGDEGFLDASFASGTDIDSDSRSVVAADFNRDGAPDLLVASVGGGPLRLFLNRFPATHHRLQVELVGVKGNRQGIGSRIVVEASGQRIVRDLFPANGGTGQSPAQWMIGVGRARKVERLTVRWPNGESQTFRDLPVDRRITLVEGQPAARIADGF